MVMIIITIFIQCTNCPCSRGWLRPSPQPPLLPGSDHVVCKGGSTSAAAYAGGRGSAASGDSDGVSAAVSAGGGG